MKGARAAGIAALLVLSASAQAARPRALTLRHVAIELPGPPVATLAADVDGDGRADLAFVVDYAAWGSVATVVSKGAETTMDVVPALEEKRELRVFRQNAEGGYDAALVMDLPRTVFAVEKGPPRAPLVALADDGIFRVAFAASSSAFSLSLAPVAHDVSALAGSGAFLRNLGLVADVDGDGTTDVLFPSRDGLALYRGLPDGTLAAAPAWRRRLPGDSLSSGTSASRFVPVPVVRDVDGDGVPDFLLRPRTQHDPVTLVRGGRGSAPMSIALPKGKNGKPEELAWLGELAHDGKVFLVTSEADEEKSEMSPPAVFRFYRVRADGTLDETPSATLDAVGLAAGDEDAPLGGFVDLDGDGRLDLVTVGADVSKFQIVRAVTTKHLTVGLAFHVYRQEADGSFRAVAGELDEKLHLNLNELSLDRVGAFSGDFDGDGRLDFVRFGEGSTVEIRRGGEGCRYPQKPDLAITLAGTPDRLSALSVADLDGDHRADLAFTHLLAPDEPGASAGVRVDLYLSGEAK